MKGITLSIFVASGFALLAADQPPVPGGFDVSERGLHHRVWRRTVRENLPNGRFIERPHSFTEVANGLHYEKDGQLLESQETIELFQNGAIARQGQFSMILAPNANSLAAVDILAADGQRFQSTVLGLGLYDSATGASELIAEIKDTLGEFHAPNQIVYPNAFDGIRASIRYMYRKSGPEQDIILEEGITLPPNFNSATTRLEVWTEFTAAPAPQKTVRPIGGMEDEVLDFGEAKIYSGRAFSLDTGEPSFPVAKKWLQIEGRTFLVEAVQFATVAAELARLGGVQQAAIRKPVGAMLANAKQGRPFPATRLAKSAPGLRIQNASTRGTKRGFVLDYTLVNTVKSLTMQGDTTYYISGPVIVTNLVIEGGCVLKYATNASIEVPIDQTITLQTDRYLPVVFTAKDDNTIGEPFGSGAPAGYYANPALRLHDAIHDFQNVRFSYAREAFNLDDGNITIRHGQFTFCQKAFSIISLQAIAENTLFYAVSNVVYGQHFNFQGRNITANECERFSGDTATNGTIILTNSLLVNVTNASVSAFTTNLVVVTSASPFQTIGAASHYLTTNSAYRNIGTTGIPTNLLNDLRLMTTYPPVKIESTDWYTNNLDLLPQAQRDADTIDLGYHYWPIDFVIGGIKLTNATLTASNGVVIATRSVGTFAIGLGGASCFLSGGSPDRPNRIIRYNAVQEQATTNWSSEPEPRIITGWLSSAIPPKIAARFTQWSTLASGGEHLYLSIEDTGVHCIADSEFHSGDLWNYGPTLNLTNCLLNRSALNLLDNAMSISPNIRHCTFHGGAHNFVKANSGTWTFMDNLFDDTTIPVQDAVIIHDYNGYTTNATRLATAPAAHDVKLSATSVIYDTANLGRFYLPTNLTSHSTLFQAGSITANLLGLYHFTCTTNQFRETNSIVDLGYHYAVMV